MTGCKPDEVTGRRPDEVTNDEMRDAAESAQRVIEAMELLKPTLDEAVTALLEFQRAFTAQMGESVMLAAQALIELEGQIKEGDARDGRG